MTQQGVHVLVVTTAPDVAATINGMLRDRGLLVQVDWARNPEDAVEQLDRRSYDIIIGVLPELRPEALAALGSRVTVPVPVIGIAHEIDEDLLNAAFGAGLRDIVAVNRPGHVAAVVQRELETFQAHRTIEAFRTAADAAEREQRMLFEYSGDALAHTHDGVIIATNPAWKELFGEDRSEAGTPVLDAFGTESIPRLRDALRSRAPGAVELSTSGTGGKQVPVTLVIRPVHDGMLELAIRAGRDRMAMAEQLERAQREDPATGLLNRKAFSEIAQTNAERTIVLIRIDHFARVVEKMGVMGSDAVAVQLAACLQESLPPGAISGRMEGSLFGVVLTETDRELVGAWCQEVTDAIGKATFDYAGRSTPLTVSIGIRPANRGNPESALDQAMAALRTAHAAGGNKSEFYTQTEQEASAEKSTVAIDWGPRLKQALVKGYFRVAFQPVASLHGDNTENNDLLLRLVDPELGEILPGDFIPAAEKAGLMLAIDRWVIGEALKFLKDPGHQRRGTTLFVRLSDDSLTSDTTLKWLTSQVKGKIPANRLVIEMSEHQAETWLREAKVIASGVKQIGCAVMLSKFGVAADPMAILQHIPPDYVKLDISLLVSLARDENRQRTLRTLIDAARERGISTIAPKVEDANSMALLWQMGVDFVQGNYLQEPEVVIADE